LETKLKLEKEKKEKEEQMKRVIQNANQNKRDFYSSLDQKKINLTDESKLDKIDAPLMHDISQSQQISAKEDDLVGNVSMPSEQSNISNIANFN
jgi:uncharacterized protein YigA (DUF484 family)